MSHWAVYVALHMPDHPSQDWSHLRESVVRELLMRHAPEWAPDASKRDVLLHKLHVPPAWLDQSLAQWSHYCRDDSGEAADTLWKNVGVTHMGVCIVKRVLSVRCACECAAACPSCCSGCCVQPVRCNWCFCLSGAFCRSVRCFLQSDKPSRAQIACWSGMSNSVSQASYSI